MSEIFAAIERLIDYALKRHVERDHHYFTTGVITAVDTTNFRATVKIGASATATTTVPYMNGGVANSYVPQVNDNVLIGVLESRQYFIFGKAPLV